MPLGRGGCLRDVYCRALGGWRKPIRPSRLCASSSASRRRRGTETSRARLMGDMVGPRPVAPMQFISRNKPGASATIGTRGRYAKGAGPTLTRWCRSWTSELRSIAAHLQQSQFRLLIRDIAPVIAPRGLDLVVVVIRVGPARRSPSSCPPNAKWSKPGKIK